MQLLLSIAQLNNEALVHSRKYEGGMDDAALEQSYST